MSFGGRWCFTCDAYSTFGYRLRDGQRRRACSSCETREERKEREGRMDDVVRDCTTDELFRKRLLGRRARGRSTMIEPLKEGTVVAGALVTGRGPGDQQRFIIEVSDSSDADAWFYSSSFAQYLGSGMFPSSLSGIEGRRYWMVDPNVEGFELLPDEAKSSGAGVDVSAVPPPDVSFADGLLEVKTEHVRCYLCLREIGLYRPARSQATSIPYCVDCDPSKWYASVFNFVSVNVRCYVCGMKGPDRRTVGLGTSTPWTCDPCNPRKEERETIS